MPRERRTPTLIWAVAILILLVLPLSGDEGAVGTKTTLAPPVPGIDEARRAFKEMDDLLDTVIRWYDEEVINGVATSQDAAWLKGYVALLHEYKKRVLKSMPDYLGASFYAWHLTFNRINDMLDEAAALADEIQQNEEKIAGNLDHVKELKKTLEDGLPGEEE